MVDLVLLAGASWIAFWIGVQPAEVALLYTAGFYASTYVATQVAPWVVLHLSITEPVLAWMTQHVRAEVPVFGPGSLHRAIPAAQPEWMALHALDWITALFLGTAVWCAFVGVHRFLQVMLDEEQPPKMGWFSRLMSGAFGVSAGMWAMLQAAPALAIFLNLFGRPQPLESDPLLDLMLRGVQVLPVFRTMI
ncbi:hypothetical protein [Alicyclobacillus acidocaldarius]|uniref:Colicin V production protein n=1 Tax=Alicyclobacillus acidocaldarius (strain Tc-4-1) TaxID=1048834 RepID=F8IED7_ALIAT|nr:hypothetical protein [Alicyclobacillus acidocaldarius]AEJ45175.1 hypothetical protein TC41_3296 [Alicyclobacillus acidocaldarius subsp. acidocaldarius Tc-4-1]